MLDWNFGSPGFNPQHFVNQAQSYRPEISALRTSKQGNEKKFKVILNWGSWTVESCPCGTRALWDGSAWETWLTNPFTVFLSVSLVHSTVSTRQLTLSWSSSCICWLSMSSVWLGGLITPVAVSQRLVGTVCLFSCSPVWAADRLGELVPWELIHQACIQVAAHRHLCTQQGEVLRHCVSLWCAVNAEWCVSC